MERLHLVDIPLNFPSDDDSFCLDHLRIEACHFDLRHQDILPIDGLFPGTNQRWDVKNSEVIVQNLYINSQSPNALDSTLMNSIENLQIGYEKRIFKLQKVQRTTDSQKYKFKILFKEEESPFNSVAVFSN